MIGVCLVILLALSSIPLVTSTGIKPQREPSQLAQKSSITRQWTISIVLVNYDDVIDDTVLLESFPTSRIFSTTKAYVEYEISYDIIEASESWENDFRTVMLTNSINGTGTGSALDETALEYQKTHPNEPQKIFYDRDGRSIDGYAVEDWLVENPAVDPPELGYVFYLLNFSEFDSDDHEIEHWFDYHPIDPDTGLKQEWFRLEWDNELNSGVKFQFAGIGGRGNIYVLDPSADQWYLQWARIWWGQVPYSNDYEHCIKDLEDKVSEIDLGSNSGREALSVYLADYMYDPISYLMFANQHQPTAYVKSGILQGIVFGMDVNDGVGIDSLQWVTDGEIQRAHLETLFPFIDWTVNIDFLDIEQFPEWETVFWDHADIVGGVTQVDGYAQFQDIYDTLRPSYVDDQPNQIEVFGVVFIKKMMEMYAGGRTFTGLGGGGQTVIWKSWERYYQSDGVTPKSGISNIQLHETMHAIGIGHTWSQYHYVGDFSYSPMGYFTMHNGTATFDQNWVQSTYLDQMEAEIVLDFEEYSEGILNDDLPKVIEARDRVEAAIANAQELYNKMDWIGCYDALSEAANWIKRMRYARIDQTPPIIDDWGTDPVNIDLQDFDVWVEATDTTSGIENVTIVVLTDNEEHRYLCELHGDSYTASIPTFPDAESLAIQAVVYDWGMNTAVTDWRVLYGTPDVPNSLIGMVEIVLIGLGVAGISIVVSIYFVKKNKL